MPRERLSAGDRRSALLDAAADLFADRAYDDVLMDDVARRAGVSRPLLYRHFATKRELFAGVYTRAADTLVLASPVDPALPLPEQVRAGLDVHLDYFEANRRTVLTANRTLAGDPTVQAIIVGEMSALRDRLLDASGLSGADRTFMASVLMAWMVFVRSLCVDWLDSETGDRHQVLNVCVGALLGALGASDPG